MQYWIWLISLIYHLQTVYIQYSGVYLPPVAYLNKSTILSNQPMFVSNLQANTLPERNNAWSSSLNPPQMVLNTCFSTLLNTIFIQIHNYRYTILVELPQLSADINVLRTSWFSADSAYISLSLAELLPLLNEKCIEIKIQIGKITEMPVAACIWPKTSVCFMLWYRSICM